VQGESPLAGLVVLSYEGEYNDDIQFNASAKDIKDKLEMLNTIKEVNVRKYDKYTGYQWVVSFTGQAGNIPLLVAHNNVFEIQSIHTSGGIPTTYCGDKAVGGACDSPIEKFKYYIKAPPLFNFIHILFSNILHN
jgi:hypothetical protein